MSVMAIILAIFTGLLKMLLGPTLPALPNIERPCGRIVKNRIIGGDAVPIHGWTWIASIENTSGDNFCGGALISPRHVLTAAHCIQSIHLLVPMLLRVSLGASYIGYGEVYSVAAIDIHPNYRFKSEYDSDIAILTLASNLQFHDQLSMICLPKEPPTNDEMVALGWGWTTPNRGRKVNQLREVNLNKLPNEKCHIYAGNFLENSMLCVGLEEGGKDACKGDSGGPLMQLDSSGAWTIQGIISFGKGCATKRYAGVYTKVYSFMDWIKKVLYN